MDIFDEKNKNIYVETLLHAPAQPRKGLFMDIQKNNLWTFMAHWWTFLTKKTKTFMSKHCFMRQPNPERGYLWTFKKIIYEHLWLIDGHFWQKKQRHLCRKKHLWRKDKALLYYFANSYVILAHLIRNTLPSITIILFHHISFYFFVNKESID